MTHTPNDISKTPAEALAAAREQGRAARAGGASQAWGQLEQLILEELSRGPKTTRELKQLGMDHGYTEEQVAKLYATRWMDLPRHPGANRYAPWTVYHPASTAAKVLGISHAIDDWLLAYMKAAGRPVMSTTINKAAYAAGFTEAQLLTAYRRCQVVAQKRGKHWYRLLAGAQA